MKIKIYALSLLSVFNAYVATAVDYYYKASVGDFNDGNSWYLDAARTQVAGAFPVTAADNAILYKMNQNSGVWVKEIDTNMGDLIASGNTSITYSKVLLGQSAPINFNIEGKLKVQACDVATRMDFNTSFAADVSDTGKLELNIGGIEVGTEVYGGGSYSAYGDVALSFSLSDWRLPTTINVAGDVKLGGGILGVDSISTITFNANETNISGVVEIQSNGSKYSQFFMARDNGTLRLGGLKSTMRSDGKLGGSFLNSSSSMNSTVVFTNVAGTDYMFKGEFSDFGLWSASGNGKMNVVMEGEGTQRIYSYRSAGMENATMNGTFTIKSGRFFLENSSIKEANRNGALSLEGGVFGTSRDDTSSSGTVYFKTAEFKSGGLAYENFVNQNSIESQASDKIVITGQFVKSGTGKISVDFSDSNGNALDLSGCELAESIDGIENWVEILTAGSLSEFDMTNLIGEGEYDANSDFYGIGVDDAYAVFKWVESIGNGYSLQVGFAQVPEPAEVAAFAGVAALIAIMLRRRK